MSEVSNDQAHRKARVLKSGLNVVAGTVLFIVILLGLYWLAGKSQQRIDLTANKMYTLSDSTRNLLKDLKDRVTITVYATEKDTPPEWTEKRNELRELLSQYRSISNGRVQYTFRDVSPGSEGAKAATDAGMEPSLMQQASATTYQINQGYFGLQAEYKGKSEPIPFIDPNTSLEYQLTRVINKVAAINIPKIGIVAPAGNPMMGQTGNFTQLSAELENEGFEVSELQATALGELSSLNILMIIDPQNLQEEALFQIDQYVMNGGNLFVAAPGVQLSNRMGMNSVMPNPPNINSILEPYGLKIDSTLVEDWQGGRQQAAITRAGTLVQYKDPLVFITANNSDKSNITKNIRQLMFAYTSTVSRSDRGTSGSVVSLVQSSDNSRVQDGQFTLEPTELKPPTPEEKTTAKDLVMMVSGRLTSRYANTPAPTLTNDDGTTRAVADADIVKKSKSESKVVVMGSALALVNQAIQAAPTNALLPLNMAEAFTRGSDVLDLRARESTMAQLRAIKPNESMWTQILIVGGIPVLLILAGFTKLFLNRRRKARYRRIYGGQA